VISEAIDRALVVAGIELAADFVFVRGLRVDVATAATTLVAHVVQWIGVFAVALSGMEPRGVESVASFAAAWAVGLVAASAFLRARLVARRLDERAAGRVVVGKLVVQAVVATSAVAFFLTR